MLQDREKLYQVYHAMLSMFLTWALVLGLNQYYQLRVFFLISAFYCLVPAFLIYLFINNRNIVTYLLLGSALLILVLIFRISGTNPIDWLQTIMEWCLIYDGSRELYVIQFAHMIILACAIVGSFLFFLLTRKQVTKIILAVVLLVAMIVLSISQINIGKAVVGISSFYIMTVLVEVYRSIDIRKSGRQEKKEGILYLAPICLLLAVTTVVLPSKPEPIQWKGITNAFFSVKEQIQSWETELDYYLGSGRSEFFVTFTGYSEDNGELKRDTQLVKDNKVAMKLSGLAMNKSIYLIGSVSDIYTGSSWEKSRTDYLPGQADYYLDYVELIYALARQDKDVLENNRLIERRSITLLYHNIKTKTFFYPLKMRYYTDSSRNNQLLEESAQINFLKAHGKGTTYKTAYLEMNLESEAFGQMLREADSFSYEQEHKITPEMAEYIQSDIFAREEAAELLKTDYYDVLARRADVIEEHDTVLPKKLPDRVYELAEEITADYDTQYDKLKAIEEYLKMNYTYSLKGHKHTGEQDFVDYFLFESKEGYCTSFASAAAVLGRCVGIPTRYIEGFLGKFGGAEREDWYTVRNSQAHAWAEAYLEGIGWIPLEATAPFYENRYSVWADKGQGWTQEDENLKNEDPIEKWQAPQSVEFSQADRRGPKVILGGIILLSAVILFLMVWIIYYYILKYRYWKAYKKADISRKMYLLFLRILKQLSLEGYELGEQETILMLANRIRDRFQYRKTTFPEVADIYMRYRYAGEEITDEELQQVDIYYRGLLKKHREEVSRWKLWLEEFIFLTKKGDV